MKRALVLAAALLVLCGGAQSATRPVPAFHRVIVVVLENKGRSQVLGNRAAPAFNAFARGGATLPEYRGVTHPSLPNYLALVSGSTHGITSDCTTCTVSGPSLADTLEAKGLTWKAYAEGLPHAGWTGPYRGRYAKKHVPFLYFRRVLSSPARLRRIVPLTQLTRDRASGSLPTFSLVVPDLCHDMHDCPVATGDAWLKRFLPPFLKLPGTAVFVVFDESDSVDQRVPALALGPLVRAGSRYPRTLSHYGLLRTIEDGLGLPRLGLSARAAPVTGIWRVPKLPWKEGSALRP
ncbi:MAG TPA: alkaline phosphatase family protein [Gaiellaceae bacterium]|nr:alkaline phosphatase family protein [Gaiellaceae bacterium]